MNDTKRWNARLNVSTSKERSNTDDVLVLKSQYNPVWNYFSASELGDTIFKTWRFNLSRWETAYRQHTAIVPCQGYGVKCPDIRALGFDNRRVIVSKKRPRNLFDLASQWKQIVLRNVDQAIRDDIVGNDDETELIGFGFSEIEEGQPSTPPQYTSWSDDDEPVNYRARRSPDTMEGW
ncbi:hypothetical protein K435DRAFT_879581 [Dendrothele bispora CBS 962.96]|uniref:Uncharacterized protein n=1 Tax=Dendrothele bispora (strain CBS 962.96) TaxID=1314807 RepID=A0A4S8KL10_DENBC|nr:hypothetical protein K435DRAFT_879581 [Dendrothele bispora CBS 962.96]